MLVIPLFLDNLFLTTINYDKGEKNYGHLKYYYYDDSWTLCNGNDEAAYPINDKIKDYCFPKKEKFWGISETIHDRYTRIYRKNCANFKRRGPRQFRCLMVSPPQILVRDFYYGGERKKCEEPIKPNWAKLWRVYDPISCKQLWPNEDGRQHWKDCGYVSPEDDYNHSFKKELRASQKLGYGCPIEHNGLWLTPFQFHTSLLGHVRVWFYYWSDGQPKAIMGRFDGMGEVEWFPNILKRPDTITHISEPYTSGEMKGHWNFYKPTRYGPSQKFLADMVQTIGKDLPML